MVYRRTAILNRSVMPINLNRSIRPPSLSLTVSQSLSLSLNHQTGSWAKGTADECRGWRSTLPSLGTVNVFTLCL